MRGVRVFLGRYELIGRLSRTASGAVWKGHDPELQRDVALKQVSGAAPELRARLASEATVLASLDHPHIVAVYDLVAAGDDLWLVEEWVDGADVTALVAVAGGLSPVQSLGVLRGALQGLAFAHEKGVVHGDVTPGNILVDRQGVSKLVDFGLAGASGRPGIGSGTAGFASPEALRGEPVTCASDVWSAGAVLTALLEPGGVPPVASDGPAKGPAGPAVPAGVKRVLERALAADPGLRQPDAGVLLAELEEAAENEHGVGWWQFAGVAGMVAAATTAALRIADDTDTGRPDTTVLPATPVSLLRTPSRHTDVVARGVGATPIDGGRAAPAKAATKRSLTAVGAAALVAVIVLVVFLLTRGDDNPDTATAVSPASTVVSEPAESATTVATVTPTSVVAEPEATEPVPAPSTASDPATVASSVPPAPVVSETPVAAPEPSVGLGFNGVYANEAVTTAIEGRIVGGQVGFVQNVQWTVETTCAPVCVAQAVSSSGRAWTATEDAGVFTIDSPMVYDCFIRPGEKSEGTTTKQVNMTFTPTVVEGGRIRELVGTAVFTQIEGCPGQTDQLSVETQTITLSLVDA